MEEYGDPQIGKVEGFGSRDSGTVRGFVGEAIRPLERCSVVRSSSKW